MDSTLVPIFGTLLLLILSLFAIFFSKKKTLEYPVEIVNAPHEIRRPSDNGPMFIPVENNSNIAYYTGFPTPRNNNGETLEGPNEAYMNDPRTGKRTYIVMPPIQRKSRKRSSRKVKRT